jgi:hypothetical protein
MEGFRVVMEGKVAEAKTPPLWDGGAAERIVKILAEEL